MAATSMTVWSNQPQLTATNDVEPRIDPAACTDETLVESAKGGDAGAFGRLIERHYRFSLSKAYSILRNRHDAEDEVQNACAEAWKHIAQYNGAGAFGGWFSRIVSNQCLMRLRQEKPLISTDQVFDSEDSFRLEVIDQRALPEDAVGDGEFVRVLMREIRGVPPLLRRVLVMRDLGQEAMPDVAAQLGISIPAAKSRLMRARLELKKRLMKHLGERGRVTLIRESGRPRAVYVRAC